MCQGSDIREFIPEALAFIDEVVANGGKILVHCMVGASRSVALVLAWLVARCRMPLKQVLQTVLIPWLVCRQGVGHVLHALLVSTESVRQHRSKSRKDPRKTGETHAENQTRTGSEKTDNRSRKTSRNQIKQTLPSCHCYWKNASLGFSREGQSFRIFVFVLFGWGGGGGGVEGKGEGEWEESL